MNSFLEVDFAQQAKGSVTTKCDACGKVLGENWMRGRENMALVLKNGADKDGFEDYKTFHVCNENCLRELLNKRAKKD